MRLFRLGTGDVLLGKTQSVRETTHLLVKEERFGVKELDLFTPDVTVERVADFTLEPHWYYDKIHMVLFHSHYNPGTLNHILSGPKHGSCHGPHNADYPPERPLSTLSP